MSVCVKDNDLVLLLIHYLTTPPPLLIPYSASTLTKTHHSLKPGHHTHGCLMNLSDIHFPGLDVNYPTYLKLVTSDHTLFNFVYQN